MRRSVPRKERTVCGHVAGWKRCRTQRQISHSNSSDREMVRGAIASILFSFLRVNILRSEFVYIRRGQFTTVGVPLFYPLPYPLPRTSRIRLANVFEFHPSATRPDVTPSSSRCYRLALNQQRRLPSHADLQPNRHSDHQRLVGTFHKPDA
jgi:hypothetical protein